MKKQDIILWLLFFVFLVVRILFKIQYWSVLVPITCALAIALLIQAKMPSKKYVWISVIFAILSTVAYLGFQQNPRVLLYGLRAGIPTLLCSLAVFSVMEKCDEYALISDKGKHPVVFSILLSVAVGAVLSVIIIFISGKKPDFNFPFWNLLLCLNPAIYEEIAYRAIFMAFCVWFADGEMNFFQKFTMYFMMCVPYAMVNGYPFVATIFLCVLFGLPFTILQKNRDITSAMISHGLVDAVRFTVMKISLFDILSRLYSFFLTTDLKSFNKILRLFVNLLR